MELWTVWLELLRGLLDALSSEVGLGLGAAIIVGTFALRLTLLPVTWSLAWRACIRQKKLLKLRPELERLKRTYADQPETYLREMTALYRRHDLGLVDGTSLVGNLVQMPVFLGMFQLLRNLGEGSRFLWIPSLLRPDVLLALIAGAATAAMMMVNPDIPEQMRLFMILVPSIVAIIAALHFCSALGIYWVSSNGFSAMQTLALHAVINRRMRSGALKI